MLYRVFLRRAYPLLLIFSCIVNSRLAQQICDVAFAAVAAVTVPIASWKSTSLSFSLFSTAIDCGSVRVHLCSVHPWSVLISTFIVASAVSESTIVFIIYVCTPAYTQNRGSTTNVMCRHRRGSAQSYSQVGGTYR